VLVVENEQEVFTARIARKEADQVHISLSNSVADLFSESRPSILDVRWQSERLRSWFCNTV
jgi:hypothetical protein